jgi:hypothetical protein
VQAECVGVDLCGIEAVGDDAGRSAQPHTPRRGIPTRGTVKRPHRWGAESSAPANTFNSGSSASRAECPCYPAGELA